MLSRIFFLIRRRQKIVLGIIIYHRFRQNLVFARISCRSFQAGLHKSRHLVHIQINIRNIFSFNISNPVETVQNAVQ